eukprot:6463872-Alexandrium_andersonii.AAC.1
MALLAAIRSYARLADVPSEPWEFGHYAWQAFGLAPTKACCATSLIHCTSFLLDLAMVSPAAE